LDFYKILMKVKKDGTVQVYPDWQVDSSKDLMVQGKSFYAFWDENNSIWSRDEFRLRQLIDADLFRYAKENIDDNVPYEILTVQSFSTRMWETLNKFIKNFPDNYHQLDTDLTFINTKVTKNDYVSKKLNYALEPGNTNAWDELLQTLYSESEREKIEWAIGSIVSGDSKNIQKFLVFYGPPASGKSTILNIIEKLFVGYTTTFDARALASTGSSFSTDVFKGNPLVAIQHDGDLSRIEDNAKLNSITSHEDMTMNEKYKPSYTARVNAFLFMGTNKPVQITDAKAGTIRRLIDVHPTGVKISPERYHILMEQIDFELGHIAHKCLQKYKRMGKYYYNGYKPVQMMYQTDEFYNFISAHYDIFKSEDGVTLKRAWMMYKEYCSEINITKLMKYSAFREELTMYFRHFEDRIKVGDDWVRSYYFGFEGIPKSTPFIPDKSYVIELRDIYDSNEMSAFDHKYKDQPAQLASSSGKPKQKWIDVTTTLSDIDTTALHFVKVPENHIVIDFDLVNEDGEKDVNLNLEAASKWPPTYTELSKSGQGVHLHYEYNGNVHELASIYDVGIEVKTLLGDSSLRRRLSKANSLDITTISSGLPKKEKRMIDNKSIQSEKSLRDLIERNLKKEIHPGTKPSIDFIHKILEDAYNNDLSYNILDLKPKIFAFAAKSSNQSTACIKIVQTMHFTGKNDMPAPTNLDDKPIVFFDVEVYPNLFIVCWKYKDSENVVRMINPTPNEIEDLFSLKLVGFNNRRYDNHILYARSLGYTNLQLYDLSQKIITDNNYNAAFGEAYNLSYADIYDFSSKKQGLKKFMIELGINHMEMDIPWDSPVPEALWSKVEDYCVNDVLGTEAVFNARKEDFKAREILAELSGLTINHTTQNHTAKIIFGEDKRPKDHFIYTDLSTIFKGYTFDGKESLYRGEIVGEGGYVYAEPGFYERVTVLDVASMHPTSIEQLNLFGKYTKNFSALKEARLAIKHKEYDRARSLLDGKLAKFLDGAESNPKSSEDLSYALKIVINIVYGLTSATFDSIFRDNRNKDNIVAKRGALFMINLKNEVQSRGFNVIHIKTDSIKIPNATPEIIEFISNYGKEFGYEFELEAQYSKFCLVNDAVYIAKENDKWTAVGAQFQHPYVMKTLFSKEPLEFSDFCEVRNVTQGAMYLDTLNSDNIEDMTHVGRTGSFVPVLDNGGSLWRVKDGKKYAVTGTKGYKWIEREIAYSRKLSNSLNIDMQYFGSLVQEAMETINKFYDFEEFVS
jgi:energy-coupling factor transporter ATP-binding protein EcfA2